MHQDEQEEQVSLEMAWENMSWNKKLASELANVLANIGQQPVTPQQAGTLSSNFSPWVAREMLRELVQFMDHCSLAEDQTPDANANVEASSLI